MRISNATAVLFLSSFGIAAFMRLGFDASLPSSLFVSLPLSLVIGLFYEAIEDKNS